MNFREKFEAWHTCLFKYASQPARGSTAMNTKYPGPSPQQYRWEGWQACDTQAFEEGYAKGLADAKTPDAGGWLRAVDEAMVSAHIGVAEISDTYEHAKKKLNELICWSIQVDKEIGPVEKPTKGGD